MFTGIGIGLYKNYYGTSTPVSSIYGATADAGEVDESISITGSKYWLDSTSGLNTYTNGSKYPGYITNPDLSQGSANATYGPFQTLAKEYTYTAVGATPAVADSAFMLKRGDTYDGFLFNKKVAASTSKYLTGAYGTGARPVVRYVNSAAQNNQTIGAAYGFYYAGATGTGPRIRNLTIDAQNVMQVRIGAITGSAPTAGQVITGGTTGTTGVFQYDSASYTLIAITNFGSTAQGYSNGETLTWSGGSCAVIAVPNAANGVWFCGDVTNGGANWEVVNCDVINTAGNGVLAGYNQTAGTSNNFTIQNSTFHDCCRAAANGAGIDGGGAGTALNTPVGQASLIESNTIYDCGIASYSTNHNMYLGNIYNTTIRLNWSYMTQNRGNHALVIHGNCDAVLVEKNLMEGCGNGLGINPGYGAAETLNGFTVRQNINRRHGRWSGQAQGYAALIAGVTNSSFYNNLWYGNCFGFSLTLGGGADSATNNLTISHETFYNNTEGVKPTGSEAQVDIGGAVTNVVLQNSIIVNTGTSHYLLRVATAAIAGTIVRNCCFYSPNYTGASLVIAWGATNYSLTDWIAWMDTNRPGHGNIIGDPLFTNAAGDDFTLQAGSPCKLAGYNSGITTDFAGNPRNATTPSIGAYE